MTVNRGPYRSGFTLIELVVGMLVLAIALVMISSMLFPQADRSSETLHRVRSAELAQAVMNEIWGKRYDQHTNPVNGKPCGGPGQAACSAVLGPEGETRQQYNDVDDYNGMTQAALMLNSTQTYADVYPNYQLLVTISGAGADNSVSKLITIVVTTPFGEKIAFDAVRSNF
ncbi:prepilin-type N-terminal cleavage/methylation domain-containing protein [Shewanella sp. NIFS-20-20]|uniref:type IV pilus modification PilV family protein n=1 Tax=Shewanella sp. NIFS-20-20 TaxID=2853806 RepID=UPI001C469F50|nr:prepilin-type N-terminal cleavage/methylation domain-containing protein [Shewanella sp. NIFS-20-20]MBV7317388.1 prepilin-type N-terminal cleavage/methylation domain-containing protein [Shewanella sp. NIFS-20-20]